LSKQEIYSDENQKVNANAIRGFLLSIVLKHKIPIIFTKDSEDSAKFMAVLSRKKSRDIRLNAEKKILNKKEQMQFIIESFPGVGPKKSKELLKKFGSIQNIINAPIEDLKKILGIRAENFIELIGRRY
ncbi:MAG: ERCC4 domain-containing protein, partial [Nanoarchaeota archaeon]